MNASEDLIREKYENQGYDVIHVGVPDFILLKDGEIEFVEVKTATDLLRESQLRAIALLEKHGFEVRVERLPIVHKSALSAEWIKTHQPTLGQATPNHTSPVQTIPLQAIPFQALPDHSNPLQTIPSHLKPHGSEMIEM